LINAVLDNVTLHFDAKIRVQGHDRTIVIIVYTPSLLLCVYPSFFSLHVAEHAIWLLMNWGVAILSGRSCHQLFVMSAVKIASDLATERRVRCSNCWSLLRSDAVALTAWVEFPYLWAMLAEITHRSCQKHTTQSLSLVAVCSFS